MKSLIIILFCSKAIAIISLFFKKKFLLSILLSLELILLNLIILNLIMKLQKGNLVFISFSLIILTLSAIEARIGISLLTLINRKFKKRKIKKLKILKK